MVQSSDASKKEIRFGRGAVIECWTLHNNPEAGRSRYYDIAIVDEAGLIPGLRKWYDTCLRATLVDRRGRLLMLGTPHAISPEFNDFYDEAATKDGWKAFPAATFDSVCVVIFPVSVTAVLMNVAKSNVVVAPNVVVVSA